MPIANPSPYPTGPRSPPFVLTFHCPPSPFHLVHRLSSSNRLLPPPTSLLHSIRPLLAARNPGLRRTAPFESPRSRPPYTPWYRHILCELPLSSPSPASVSPSPLLADPRGHHARVVSSLVIVVCDAGNLYYAAPSVRIALHARADSMRLHAGENTRERERERSFLFTECFTRFASKFFKSIIRLSTIFQFSLQQIFHPIFIRENLIYILLCIE